MADRATSRPNPGGKRNAHPAEPGRSFEDQLLDAGQEEVFSRAEVEAGRIEHGSASGRHGSSQAERDEAQTERQAPNDANPGEAAD